MKQWLFKLVVLLLLGAVVNVAVAWGCANWRGKNPPLLSLFDEVFSAKGFDKVREQVSEKYFPKPLYISLELIEQGEGLSVKSMEIDYYASGESWVRLWEDKPDSHLVAAKIIRTGLEQRIIHIGEVSELKPISNWPPINLKPYRRQFEWAQINIGLPLKSLSYTPLNSNPNSANQQANVWFLPNEFSMLFPSTNDMIFPYGVNWPSFLINTIFYAVLLWILWLSLLALRRFIRHKRGRCRYCAYDLRRGSSVGCPECGCGREAEA